MQTIGILCLHRRPKQRDTLRLPNSSVQLPNPRPFIESCIKARLSVWGCKADEIKLDEVKVGTTKENLEAAIKGESHERDARYPEFLSQANQDKATAAVRSFTFAVNAEKEHAKLYQDALDNLGHNAATDYFVCSVCGFTTTQLPAKNCPSCHNGVEKFLKIS